MTDENEALEAPLPAPEPEPQPAPVETGTFGAEEPWVRRRRRLGMATEGYDYLVTTPCRAAIEAAVAEFRAAKTESEDLATIAAFWATQGRVFCDALGVPTCPDYIDVKRDALIVAMSAWVGFMEAAAADGDFSQTVYLAVANDASTALRELEGTISAGERTQ